MSNEQQFDAVGFALTNKIKSELSDIVQQVKAIKVITQAQYDALPVDKTTDNCLYLIRG